MPTETNAKLSRESVDVAAMAPAIDPASQLQRIARHLALSSIRKKSAKRFRITHLGDKDPPLT
jgi:hypothetical protein